MSLANGLLLILLAWGSAASAIEVRLGTEVAPVGAIGKVDITVADATGLASAAFKVNFDPSVLDLVLVTNETGSIGAEFAIASTVKDGSVDIVLVRKDGLPSGGGSLASLHFRVNPGAPNGMNTEIVVAKCELGGDYGVGLTWGGDAIAATDGTLWAVASMSQDSDANGIPDWWEIQHFGGLTNAVAGADDDGDSASNLDEYRAGTDPNDPSNVFRLTHLTGLSAGAGISIKWSSVLAKSYDVERTTNLFQTFQPLATNLVATGTEFTYTDSTATNAIPYFYRIKTRE